MVTPYLKDENKVWTFQRGRTVHSSFPMPNEVFFFCLSFFNLEWWPIAQRKDTISRSSLFT